VELEFQGEESVKVEPGKALSMLADPNFLARTIPDFSEYEPLSGSELLGRVRIGLTVVSGTMKVRLKVQERLESSLKIAVEASGLGSEVRISITFDFFSKNGETLMSWRASADISGLLSGLGSTLLRGYSERKIDEVMRTIRQALEA
jgi:carbon monoxide dehydrogenase subunit G